MKEIKMEEIWKLIEGWERYSISSFGKIYDRKNGKFIGCYKSNRPRVKLQTSIGWYETYTISRLVARTFLPPSEYDYGIVRYKDKNPKNLRADNLIFQPLKSWVKIKESLK
jgi:hypothetical protein